MTEFEKFWQNLSQSQAPLVHDKTLAEQVWHAAQRALLRTISTPPHTPKSGDKIRLNSLCHPDSLGRVKEVVGVTEDHLKVYWMETREVRDGEEFFSSGILGEVEPE